MAPTGRPTVTALGVLVAGLLAGCTQPSYAFNVDDKIGYIACRDAVAAQAMDGGANREALVDAAAASAAASQTPTIRQLVSPPVDEDQLERIGPEDRGLYSVEIDELVAACEQAGFNPADVDLPESG